METKMNAFLEKGIGLYIEAKNTLRAFETETERMLSGFLQSRKTWSPLKQVKLSDTRFGGGRGEYGWWVSTLIDGRAPRGEKATIDCGVWWSAPEPKDECIVFAS